MSMGNYFRDFWERIQDTKKFAREKNVPVWEIPLVNSIGIILLTSIYLSFYTWMAIPENVKPEPFWWGTFIAIANWAPLIYLGLICLVMLDKVLRVFILFQAALTKLVMDGITKIDHKIWRKTGKDSYVANKIWKVQMKWMKMPKEKRKKIMILAIFLFGLYYLHGLIF